MNTIYDLRTIRVKLRVSEPEGKKASDIEVAVRIVRDIYSKLDDDQEHFTLLALNNKNRVTGYKVLFSGGSGSSTVDPKIVFRKALLLGATRIIVAHNHPGGDPKPSLADHELTGRLQRLGDALSLPLFDHIIIAERGPYWSLAQNRAFNDLGCGTREQHEPITECSAPFRSLQQLAQKKRVNQKGRMAKMKKRIPKDAATSLRKAFLAVLTSMSQETPDLLPQFEQMLRLFGRGQTSAARRLSKSLREEIRRRHRAAGHGGRTGFFGGGSLVAPRHSIGAGYPGGQGTRKSPPSP